MGKSKFQISHSLDERIGRIISGNNDTETEFTNVQSAYILGFNYANVTNCVGLTTNYQLHHAVFPVVGLVYFQQCPSDEEIKSDLKSIKNYSSSPNGLGSFKSDKNEHLFLIYSVAVADQAPTKVDKRIFNFSKGTFVRRKRHRLCITNDPYCPKNVYDGNEDIFSLDADAGSMSSNEDEQIDHLIFFIHGVGGVCDVRFRSCVEVVADFKKMANALLAQHSNPSSGASTPTNRHLASSLKRGLFRKQHSTESSASRDSDQSDVSRSTPSSPMRRRIRKVECLPISWHSLTRRQTGVSEQLNLIALGSVPKLRQFLNKVVMDAMLYSSGPVFTQTIINNVGNEINRLYTLFMEKHPNFSGSVSLAGHSLGSVIVFDLLAHQLATSTVTQERTSSQANNLNVEPNRADKINNNHKEYDQHSSRENNTRSKCLNISHKHYMIEKDEFSRSCSEYKDLSELLRDMNLEEHAELFQKEHINLDNLILLTDFDLKELRLPLGARRLLGTYINFKKIARLPIETNQSESLASAMLGEKSEYGQLFDPFSNMNTGQCLVEYPQLKFKPRCFFAFGSPTPMFLNVRGIRQLSGDYKFPTCDRMLNIFHPYDPLAYRFEPLIDPRFKEVEPVLIPHHRGGKRIHVQLREGFARVGHDIKHKLLGSLRNTWSSFTRLGQTEDLAASAVGPSSGSRGDKATAVVVNETSDSIDGANKKARLIRSYSSSAEYGDRESFESCRSSFSQPSESLPTNSTRRTKNLLARQQQVVRSQSEATNASSYATGQPSLSSIIESSILDDSSMTSDEKTKSRELEQEEPPLGEMLNPLTKDHFDPKKADEASKIASDLEQKSRKTSVEHIELKSRKDDRAKESGDAQPTASVDFDSTKVGRLNCGRRIDYVLQEKPIELFNEYIFAFTSHANYWQNEDCALIILNEIYQADGVQLLDPSEY